VVAACTGAVTGALVFGDRILRKVLQAALETFVAIAVVQAVDVAFAHRRESQLENDKAPPMTIEGHDPYEEFKVQERDDQHPGGVVVTEEGPTGLDEEEPTSVFGYGEKPEHGGESGRLDTPNQSSPPDSLDDLDRDDGR
jgi:hypothetical protein